MGGVLHTLGVDWVAGVGLAAGVAGSMGGLGI